MNKGIPVLDLIPGSHADRAGVKRGDIVLSVNGSDVNNMDDYIAACAKDSNHTRRVIIQRDGITLELEMVIGKPINSSIN